jgi:imidazole glycerol phosphate synthase glutamine amidotransferase subunit
MKNGAKISLIEYGAGNLPSVERALARQGVETERAGTPESVAAARVLILPGVGHFGQLMRTLGSRGLLEPIREAIRGGIPLLGICLGLQALFTSSAEAPEDRGLDVIAGNVDSLPVTSKLPHMGWNQLRHVRPSALLEGIPANAYFYFAHSYAALDAGESAIAICEHGVPFVAALERRNLFAVQFHPEKSGDVGARVLANFVAYAGAGNRG